MNGIIDAEKIELELELDLLRQRINDLEVKLQGAQFLIEHDYRELKSMQIDLDDMYVRVF